MKKALERLINKHYYDTREEIETKVVVLYGYNIINDEDFADLMELIEKEYPIVEDIPAEEIPDETV